MSLPEVTIQFQNGALGRVQPNEDGVVALITYLQPNGNFSTDEPYLLKNLNDLYSLSLDPDERESHYKFIKIIEDFYSVAGNGAPLYVTFAAGFNSYNIDTAFQKTIQKATVKPKLIFVSGNINESTSPVENQNTFYGIWLQQVLSGVVNSSANYEKIPLALILDLSYNYGGNFVALRDYRSGAYGQYNRLGVFIGYKKEFVATLNQWVNISLIGRVMGRAAITPVHRNIARVKDGPIFSGDAYIANILVENAVQQTVILNQKGYITLRTFPNKQGYYLADDNLLAPVTNDFCQLSYRRTIDKAFRIVNDVVTEELLNDVPVNADGTVQAHYARTLESLIVSAIYNEMTAKGELNVLPDNPNDKGVVATVDETYNVLNTGEVKVNVGVRPYGYARYITIKLGFKTNNN
ncbi:MAG: DUF2586 domain-containing protein [Chitinophagaceae bacterium]|nr:DUF2586 domain-containing protein [Chitinophagaceae bacterium]